MQFSSEAVGLFILRIDFLPLGPLPSLSLVCREVQQEQGFIWLSCPRWVARLRFLVATVTQQAASLLTRWWFLPSMAGTFKMSHLYILTTTYPLPQPALPLLPQGSFVTF